MLVGVVGPRGPGSYVISDWPPGEVLHRVPAAAVPVGGRPLSSRVFTLRALVKTETTSRWVIGPPRWSLTNLQQRLVETGAAIFHNE
jgi:hypothetical protein